jgi:hypothetical protein
MGHLVEKNYFHRLFGGEGAKYLEGLGREGKIILKYILTLTNPIFLTTANSPALICFGRERGWWITYNYPTVLKAKNMEKQREYNLRYLLAKVRTT